MVTPSLHARMDELHYSKTLSEDTRSILAVARKNMRLGIPLLSRRPRSEVVILKEEQTVRELLTTEQAYIAFLNKIMQYYYMPFWEALQKNKPIVPWEDMRVMFSNLNAILKLNTSFLNEISPIIKSWGITSRLGDIISTYVHFFIFLIVFSGRTICIVQILCGKLLPRNRS
jgi:hypothetical protein